MDSRQGTLHSEEKGRGEEASISEVEREEGEIALSWEEKGGEKNSGGGLELHSRRRKRGRRGLNQVSGGGGESSLVSVRKKGGRVRQKRRRGEGLYLSRGRGREEPSTEGGRGGRSERRRERK